MIDPVRTEQAVANLVSNALKFTPPGGEVNLAAHRGDKMIELTVSDSGVGIDPAEVERVFERFYRSKAAVDTAVKGTGLGLAIVRTIVEAQRGNVSVESTLGRGTSFRLTLPLADKLPEPV